MNALSALIPTLRDIRAPLAAGYVYLLAVWVAVGDRLPDRAEVEPGSVADLVARAADMVGPAGVLAALSFCAYLVGTLVGDMLDELTYFVRKRFGSRLLARARDRSRKRTSIADGSELPTEIAEELERASAEGDLRVQVSVAAMVLTICCSIQDHDRIFAGWLVFDEWFFLAILPLLIVIHGIVILIQSERKADRMLQKVRGQQS